MNYLEIAKLIPAEYRKEILETNMINKAIGVSSDPSMFYLHTIWKEFIEPDVGNCNLCFNRVLENYKQMVPTFVELAKQESLLEGL